MSKQVSISLPNWIISEMITNHKNKSERVQELMIKGYFVEKLKKEENLKNQEMGFSEFYTGISDFCFGEIPYQKKEDFFLKDHYNFGGSNSVLAV